MSNDNADEDFPGGIRADRDLSHLVKCGHTVLDGYRPIGESDISAVTCRTCGKVWSVVPVDED